MADNPRLYGFRFKHSRSGVMPIPEVCRVASGYQGVDANAVNCDLRPGDPVAKVNDGTVAIVAGGSPMYGIVQSVIQYWDGTVLRKNDKVPGGSGVYGTVFSRETLVTIIPLADNIFEAVCDDASTATTYAAYRTLIHNNLDHRNSGNTSTTSLQPELDISSNGTGTAGWRIVDVPFYPHVDYSGLYVPLLVTGVEIQQAPYLAAGV